MIAIPLHWQAWSLIYSHDVIDIDESYHFLGIGDKVPSVLSRIKIALLNNLLKAKAHLANW